MSVAAPRYVSFLSFCVVNVLIDIESLHNMLAGRTRIHTFFHTYVGASFVAVYLVALFIAARWLALRLPDHLLLRWRTLGVVPVVLGSVLGAWSHVLLDSVMHSDIVPLWPWSQANPLFQVISTTDLHWACVASGGVAAAWFLLRAGAKRIRFDR